MEMELISDQCVPPLPASGVVTLKRSPLSPLLWNLVGYLAPPLILFPTSALGCLNPIRYEDNTTSCATDCQFTNWQFSALKVHLQSRAQLGFKAAHLPYE